MGKNDMNDDANLIRQQRLFADQIDQMIRDTNREVIHGLIPKLDKATFAKMAHAVATLRVKYVAASVQLAGTEGLSPTQFNQLRAMREQYDEARMAFDAVKRAIVRSYIDMAE